LACIFGRGRSQAVATDLRDDDGDVVGTTAGPREIDQLAGCLGQILGRGQHFLDLFIADDADQTIGAQHHPIATTQRLTRQHHLDVFLDAERLQDDVRVLEQLGLLGRDLPRVEQLVDQRLIVGDLRQRPGPTEVRPAVTDLRDDDLRAHEHHAGQRRAHAVLRQVAQAASQISMIGPRRRVSQPARHPMEAGSPFWASGGSETLADPSMLLGQFCRQEHAVRRRRT
jgi:hypothetical protein